MPRHAGWSRGRVRLREAAMADTEDLENMRFYETNPNVMLVNRVATSRGAVGCVVGFGNPIWVRLAKPNPFWRGYGKTNENGPRSAVAATTGGFCASQKRRNNRHDPDPRLASAATEEAMTASRALAPISKSGQALRVELEWEVRVRGMLRNGDARSFLLWGIRLG